MPKGYDVTYECCDSCGNEDNVDNMFEYDCNTYICVECENEISEGVEEYG